MKIADPTTSELRLVTYGIALLRLGFRPFYLGGAFFGFVAITLWLFALDGYPVAGRSVAVNGMLWHVHEMIFGFVAAIVAGFLLTAVRAWTALDTPQGASLAWLWLLLAAGWVLVWSGPQPVPAIVDSAFLPIVAIVLLCVLITARNHHKAARALKLASRSGIGLGIGVAVATIFPQYDVTGKVAPRSAEVLAKAEDESSHDDFIYLGVAGSALIEAEGGEQRVKFSGADACSCCVVSLEIATMEGEPCIKRS